MLLIKKWLPKIIVILGAIAIISVLFEKCGADVDHKAFKAEMDSLHKVNDSLLVEIKKDDAQIDSLNQVDADLKDKLAHQKTKIITVDHWVDSSKGKIDTYTEHELVSSFNNRYPKDTITNPLPLAQPVLVAAAKDLVELDGAKQKLVLKDTIINGLELRVTLKDSVINKYVAKEDKYKLILVNKDKEIAGWEDQYNKLDLQYRKLKVKSKFQRIGSYLIIGGLGYLMLAK